MSLLVRHGNEKIKSNFESWQEDVQKMGKNDNGNNADTKTLGQPTKITPKTKDRVRHLAMNQVTGIRSAVMKMNFSEDCLK